VVDAAEHAGCSQGCFMTGVWVLAHECGHQAFSPYKWLNHCVGMVLHSALLVPYHSWRISHGNHHKNTCSMENDEVFVPPTRSEYNGAEIVEDSPLWNLVGVVKMLLFGWPLYLVMNIAGPAKYRGKKNSHFNPQSALFKESQRAFVSLVRALVTALVGM
jgi:omega-6 fatty acid desaturase / acyl-lipid omega-6 desaturase (Delta-12 desaturase)